jgi:hypothetical protein
MVLERGHAEENAFAGEMRHPPLEGFFDAGTAFVRERAEVN